MSSSVGPRARGLVARLYLVSVALLLVIAVTTFFVGRLFLHPPEHREGPESARYVVETVAAYRNDPVALARELARARSRTHASFTVYDAQGHPLFGNAATPPAPPTSAERAWLDANNAVERRPGPVHVLLLGLHDEGLYAAYLPPPPPPHHAPRLAWPIVIALLACAASSVLLARSLAAPLTRLAETARAFGAGQLAARTHLVRHDEFGEVARAFDEMAERIGASIRGQKELLANVSHELRTPLARIRVALDLAAEGDATTARESLAEITEDLAELERLVSDVLQSARLDLEADRAGAEAPRLRREAVAVQSLIDRAATRFRGRHPQHVLAVEVSADPATFDADVSLLHRALDNLLDNAAKYSDPETTVSLRAVRTPDAFEVEVEDHGIGIEPEDLSRVGTPFFRTDRSRARRSGGVGLGLSLSRRIVEAHGGVLLLESEPAQGTRARIVIPC